MKSKLKYRTVAMWVVIGLFIVTAGIFFWLRKQAKDMVGAVVEGWKAGEIGSLGEDFRDVPEEVLVKILPETEDPELKELFALYEYKEDKEADTDLSKEEGDVEYLSDEAYWELMKEEYPSSLEAGQEAENDNGTTLFKEGGKLLDVVKSRVEVSYELPAIILFPLEIDITVTAPSVEDAYLNAGKDYEDAAHMQEAMIAYIESGKAKMITQTRTIKFHKSGNKVYAEPDPELVNVLAGGYPDFIASVLKEADQ